MLVQYMIWNPELDDVACVFLTSSEPVFFALRLPIFRRIGTSSANCIKRRKARLQNQSVLWSRLPDGRELCAVLPESRTVDTTAASLWTWAAFVESISVALENYWNPKNTFWGMLDKSGVLLNSQYSRYSLLSLCNEVCWALWGRWEMRIQRAHTCEGTQVAQGNEWRERQVWSLEPRGRWVVGGWENRTISL